MTKQTDIRLIMFFLIGFSVAALTVISIECKRAHDNIKKLERKIERLENETNR